jgi:GMC oxidoreductase
MLHACGNAANELEPADRFSQVTLLEVEEPTILASDAAMHRMPRNQADLRAGARRSRLLSVTGGRGGPGANRVRSLLLTITTAPCPERTGCTDATENRTDRTRDTGIPGMPCHGPCHARRRASSMDVTERGSRDSPSRRRPLSWPGTALPRGLPRAGSTGQLASADPAAAPVIDPGYLTEPDDRRLLLDGMELTRAVMDSKVVADQVSLELSPGPDYRDRASPTSELPDRACAGEPPMGTWQKAARYFVGNYIVLRRSYQTSGCLPPQRRGTYSSDHAQRTRST